MALTCRTLSKYMSDTRQADQGAKHAREMINLVSHRSPLVQLEEPFAVLF
jgi:hypothetical protein